MAVLMGAMVVTGLYDITLVGDAPLWTGLGLALQVAVTEELWMRALLLRLLWRAFGPLPAFAVAALVFGALHLANPAATDSSRQGLGGPGLRPPRWSPGRLRGSRRVRPTRRRPRSRVGGPWQSEQPGGSSRRLRGRRG